MFSPNPDIDDISDLVDSPGQSGNGKLYAAKKNVHVEEMYDGRWSLLAPNQVLDPSGRGTLWQLSVNLKAILNATFSSSLVIPFLMRRRANSTLTRSLCLDRLKEILEESGDIGQWAVEWAAGYSGGMPASPEDVDNAEKVRACESRSGE